MFGKNSDDRFEVSHKEGTMAGFKVIVDKKTGVNYLFTWDGYAGGLTVLLDKEGKPVVTDAE
ncbi:hypothetical protein JMF89_11530 [Clostridiaceae bacterium UIB06]|uniref:DUF6440 domain-containing protein n=1 Tax=Clostridium thailandense TaxID=2794346 RepID=A0A949U0G3_9CLOT|nr:DUF6440 family protein [Clostridium thailandense]MBV7275161.1 hypothetical protein [Clostridium thailandense]MCH5137829.1 hypothetical protein [Clostridiaceae bacterium UIB06]